MACSSVRFTNFGLDIQARTLALVGGVVAVAAAGLVDIAGNREVVVVATLAEPREVEVDAGKPPHWPWDSSKAKHLTINPSMDEISLSEVVLALIMGW